MKAAGSLRVEPGSPQRLGASWDGKGVNFALFSAHAERVELCLFDSSGRREIARAPLPEYTNEVWHGYLPDARPGTLYGYRVYGPYDPARGHRFNHHKLLLDPYAKSLHGRLLWSDAHFGYHLGHRRGDLSFDRRDNARGMPKCIVVDDAYAWQEDRRPATPWSRSLVYEMHLRGFTMKHPAVPQPLRGSFAALSTPEVLNHIKRLGVTAVELLPIHGFVDDRPLVERQLVNYWGYNSIAFCAPEPRYLATGHIDEFKTMVRHLHDAGLEVILDVVYNHTAEGSELGPTLCFRGIDNLSYYRLRNDDLRRHQDFTGCGNTLRLDHPRVLQLVLDSLRYWVEQMHVDGFRFDLATSLARAEAGGFDPHSSFLDAVGQDPVLSKVKLIAEPWDLGDGGYRVGGFPPGWAEWNDRYRDTVRRFWKGDAGIGELASRVAGSRDIFGHRGRRPWSSVNFITAHDGFTLRDLVSFNAKHNEANGEGNRDGTDNNNSWNCGVEGPTDDAEVLELRQRQQRNFLATLLLSQGTPMLLAGDELGNSQQGNNNAYAQDNGIGWLDWDGPQATDGELYRFVARLVELRRRHGGLSRDRFLTGDVGDADGLKDVTWLAPEGREKTPDDWNYPGARCLSYLLSGAGAREAPGALTDPLLVVLNAHHEPITYLAPKLEGVTGWRWLIDTSRGILDRVDLAHDARLTVPPRSVAVLLARGGDRPVDPLGP